MQESKRILEVNCIKIKEGKYQINRKFFSSSGFIILALKDSSAHHMQVWLTASTVYSILFGADAFVRQNHWTLLNIWREWGFLCTLDSRTILPLYTGIFKKVTNRARRKKDRRKKDWYPVWYDTSIYFLSVFIRCFRKTRTKLSCGESRVVFGFYALLNWPNIFCL